MRTKQITRGITCRILSGGAALLWSALLLGGCSQEDDFADDGAGEVVNFTAGIQATRTTTGGNAWTTTDRVGIFMVTAGGDLANPADMLANNRAYSVTNTATGTLAPSDTQPIYYPQSGNVDFIAYYPYGAVPGREYNISLAGQTSEAAQNTLDMLYAKTTNVAKSKTAVGLRFGHVLSKVTLNVSHGTGFDASDISSLAATGVKFNGMPASGTLALQGGTLTAKTIGTFNPLKAATAAGGVDAMFTALLIPQITGGAGRTVTFTVGGKEYIWMIDNEDVFAPSTHYTYPVTVNRYGVTVGAPTITKWNTNDNGSGALTQLPDIERVRIPAGTFLMGSPASEWGRRPDETQHQVTLTGDFYMSKYEITNAEYAEFLNAVGVPAAVPYETVEHEVSGYGIQPLFWMDEWGWTPRWNDVEKRWEAKGNTPMIYISWYGAKAYADWAGGALPTEAQWEYACRAGTTSSYHFGDDSSLLVDYGWVFDNVEGNYSNPYPVGLKLPNAYGLYDMYGNVAEWCSDWYGDDYGSSSVTDPTGPATGTDRVLRGGSIRDSNIFCRSASRNSCFPVSPGMNYGIRVVFPAPQ